MAPAPVFAALSSIVRGSALALPLLLASCGDSPPRLSLLQVMYQIDFEDQALRAALGRGDLEAARAAGARLRERFADPAFESYLERPDLRFPPERFTETRRSFQAQLDGLVNALAAGEVAGANRLYPGMRMACEVCHRDFRPGL